MGWAFLIIAGMGEVCGVMSIKAYTVKKKIMPLLGIILSFTVSFFFLSQAFNTIPMGTAYAVWTGIGTVGSALFGILIYKESREAKRLFFIGLILIGAVGLKLFG